MAGLAWSGMARKSRSSMRFMIELRVRRGVRFETIQIVTTAADADRGAHDRSAGGLLGSISRGSLLRSPVPGAGASVGRPASCIHIVHAWKPTTVRTPYLTLRRS